MPRAPANLSAALQPASAREAWGEQYVFWWKLKKKHILIYIPRLMAKISTFSVWIQQTNRGQSYIRRKFWPIDTLSYIVRVYCINLNGIDFPELDDKEVSILIGSDVQEVHWTLEERRGGPKEPLAVRYSMASLHCSSMASLYFMAILHYSSIQCLSSVIFEFLVIFSYFYCKYSRSSL
jgi:hypothetical protein